MSHTVDTFSTLTHSLTPIGCSFSHTSHLLFYGKILSLEDVHYVFFSPSWELLCICSYVSQDMFKCHNTVMSTSNVIPYQHYGSCKAFFLAYKLAAASVSRQKLPPCYRYTHIQGKSQRLQTESIHRQPN